jgi:hypothetical protein
MLEFLRRGSGITPGSLAAAADGGTNYGNADRAAVKCSQWLARRVSPNRLVTQGPAHDSWVGWFCKSPLPLPNEAPDRSGQLTAVEVANCFKHWNHRKGALDAAMHALRIAVVKMRAHHAKRQVPLHAMIELGSFKPLAQRLLPGNEQGAAKERPDSRP